MRVILTAAPVRRRLRALSVALAVLGLVAVGLVPIFGSHHRATHTHVTCAHGEQIELAAAPDLAVAVRGPGDGTAVLDAGGGSPGTEEGHHHCALGCAVAARLAAAPASAHAIALAPVALAGPPIPSLRTVAVLADAPKTSPPA